MLCLLLHPLKVVKHILSYQSNITQVSTNVLYLVREFREREVFFKDKVFLLRDCCWCYGIIYHHSLLHLQSQSKQKTACDFQRSEQTSSLSDSDVAALIRPCGLSPRQPMVKISFNLFQTDRQADRQTLCRR